MPVPVLVKACPVAAVVNAPVKVVERLAPPKVSVLEVVDEFAMVPAPLNEPIVWS